MNWQWLGIHAAGPLLVSQTWDYIGWTNLFLAGSARVLNPLVVEVGLVRQERLAAAVLQDRKEHPPCPLPLAPNYPSIQRQVAYSTVALQNSGCRNQAVHQPGVDHKHQSLAVHRALAVQGHSHQESFLQEKTSVQGHAEPDKMERRVDSMVAIQHCSVGVLPSLVDQQLAVRPHRPMTRQVGHP